MSDLPEAARALLEAARSAHDPSRSEREQADGAVRAALAAYGVHVPPLGSPAPAAWEGFDATLRAAGPAGVGVGVTAKIGVGVLALCAGVWLGLRVYEREPARDARPEEEAVLAAPPQAAQAVVLAGGSARAVQPVEAAAPSALVLAEPTQLRARARVTPRSASRLDVDIDAELRMIAEADALLRAERFEAALRTLGQHARRFPQGALREERAALRVLSLCGKQPGPEALRERERFLRKAPQSVLTARVSAACAEPGAHSP